VTTRAPIPFLQERQRVAHGAFLEIVATSWLLFAKRFETCTTTSLWKDDQSEPGGSTADLTTTGSSLQSEVERESLRNRAS